MSSLWMEDTNYLNDENLIDGDYSSDVCIIGGGITGLSTAYYLAKNGLRVIVIEKNKLAEKTSGNTTAKITSGHGLIYDYLIKSFGEKFALGYLESNQKAIENIKKIIDEEEIECDFEYQPNIIYATSKEDRNKLENEINALNVLCNFYNDLNKENILKTKFIEKTDLPFDIEGAIRVENQAQFHPRKYMEGLVKSIKKYNGIIFTNTVVKNVEKEDDYYQVYANENIIKSKYVVVASHYPIINFPGFYFTKMYQVTSYAIAIQTEKNLPNGMFINAGEPVLSFRNVNHDGKRLLIVSGGNHKTGYSPESKEFFGYSYLENEVKKYYPDYKIKFKWNTRDCVTLDKVPYIGEFSDLMKNCFVATGFNKWGMTTSNVAANIITDKILGKENKYLSIYESTRLKPIKNRQELENMVKQTVKSFITNRIKIPEEKISKIKKENGGIIKIDGVAVGIYRDKTGKIYAVNPTCTHLGCLLTWNNIDKTWDCPCHGSRFNYDGENLYEPAIKGLEKIGKNIDLFEKYDIILKD